ncbi:MAG: DNA-directed RNA polymerase subunit alpha [Candidatus Sungbacteria bacterium]|nr:DNA-directed RNA polymerase subunit alpha [Candidatus Sungbacteria bacterium]
MRGMISLPSKPKVVSEEGNRAVFEIEGLYPGYGQTIGNSLRRVLLSSIKGAALTAVKIVGVGHEFSTMEGIKEDMVDLILNLKQMRFRLYEEGPFTITISASGEKEVKGKDFKIPSQVELVTPNIHIATLTSKKAKFEAEAIVESGFGYVPAEARTKEKVEVGTIALDAAFSPVRHVNYAVENMRVGDRIDYNLVRFDIETDGSLAPREAFTKAAQILVEQFGALGEGFAEAAVKLRDTAGITEKAADENKEGILDESAFKVKLDELKFSSRTLNALREAGIKTVGGLSRKKESTLRGIEGMGDKGIQEVKKALGNFGITLKQ